MTITALLFDLDGTLVDSNDFHVSAWQEAFRQHGVELSAAVIHGQIGKGGDLLVPALLPGADEKTAEALGSVHDEIFKAKYRDQVKPFPSAHELLARAAQAGVEVVIASSASSEDLKRYVDLLEAQSLVTASTTIDDVETSKPAPDIFATALKKIGRDPGCVLGLGDSPYDVEAAGKCGIGVLAVRSGRFADEALQDAGALALYDDVAAILSDFERVIEIR